jgi:hypothetical protein
MPDAPGAPSQLNDALLNEWPFGERGAPLWHMDGPIDRLLRLCEKHPRVCLGWTGAGKHLDRPEYHQRMEEVARAMGNQWHPLHMMRGLTVARMYPFASADGTSLAQNGWRYDSPLDTATGDRWRGRKAYADQIEGVDRSISNRRCRASQQRRTASRPHLADNSMVDWDARRSGDAERVAQLSLAL